ncbi:MAG: hypothetical protein Fur005_09590 [Roseiflexaceae bacterium]
MALLYAAGHELAVADQSAVRFAAPPVAARVPLVACQLPQPSAQSGLYLRAHPDV